MSAKVDNILDNLNEEQKKIVEAKEDKIVVLSVPASGKTTVLTERVKYLIEQGADPSKTVVITFTNAAAEEMKKRIGEIGKGVFINTIHSYANYLLLSEGINTSEVLSEENFDGLFELVSDNLNCIQQVDYLLVDEVQDCDTHQFEFLLDYINPKSFFFVGDIRQTIYEWRDSRPDILYSLTQREDVTTYALRQNYRNGREIITFASNIINKLGIKYTDNTIPMRKAKGRVFQMNYSINNIIDKILYSQGDFGDWFILVRNNDQLKEIYDELVSSGIPCETFKKSDLNRDSLKEKLNNNTVKILTIHAAKGLEAKNVIVVGVHLNIKDKESYRIAYVAATRAKDLLIWCTNKKPKKIKLTNWE